MSKLAVLGLHQDVIEERVGAEEAAVRAFLHMENLTQELVRMRKALGLPPLFEAPADEEIDGVRLQLKLFTFEMEKQLRANDESKGVNGWNGCDAESLQLLMQQAADNLEILIDRQAPRVEIWKKAADVANYAMMIADVSGKPDSPQI